MASPRWTSDIKAPIADWCLRKAQMGDLDPTGTGRPAAALRDFGAYVGGLRDGDPRLTALEHVNLSVGGTPRVLQTLVTTGSFANAGRSSGRSTSRPPACWSRWPRRRF